MKTLSKLENMKNTTMKRKC